MKSGSVLTTKDGILLFLKAHQAELKSFGVKRLGLFGSFVRNEQHAQSDMDFLVEYEPDLKTLRNYFGLMDWLEDAFKVEIDLITTESLSPHIGPYIEKEVVYVPLSN
ncbi:MAG: nucleotidyltransferase family protein [Bacteroidia bacterium]